MKPMGRKPHNFPNKIDCHCKKDDLINWWEDLPCENKKGERQRVKKEIKEALFDVQILTRYKGKTI